MEKRKKDLPERRELNRRKRKSAAGRRRRPDSRGEKKQKRIKRRRKIDGFRVMTGTILIAAVCVFVFSLYQLVMMLVPYYSGGKEYDHVKDIAVTADSDGKGFSVDFDTLLAENPDTIAWIRFDEPEIISYPVVKSADNEEYLTKTFTANDNKLGAIFADMRNSSDFTDRNTFIYGHHLNVGGEMFSQLLEYEDESFCKEHPDFYIYTPDGKIRTYTVFAAGEVSAVSENYQVEFASDEEYEQFLGKCSADSAYPVDVELNAGSQIITLSTCTGDGHANRFVVRGVLTAVD